MRESATADAELSLLSGLVRRVLSAAPLPSAASSSSSSSTPQLRMPPALEEAMRRVAARGIGSGGTVGHQRAALTRMGYD